MNFQNTTCQHFATHFKLIVKEIYTYKKTPFVRESPFLHQNHWKPIGRERHSFKSFRNKLLFMVFFLAICLKWSLPMPFFVLANNDFYILIHLGHPFGSASLRLPS